MKIIVCTDDSQSMQYGENGRRIAVLERMLKAIATVYSLARERGIERVKFINNSEGKRNVVERNVHQALRGHTYSGIARVGTELRNKILHNFIMGVKMKKPMLVMVIVGQAVRFPNYSLTLFKANAEPSLARGRVSGCVVLRHQELSL